MKEIINYFRFIIDHDRHKIVSLVTFIIFTSLACLWVSSLGNPRSFWQYWLVLGGFRTLPITFVVLKFLFIIYILMLVEVLDIRHYEVSLLYFVLSRYRSQNKAHQKINTLLSMMLAVFMIGYYSMLIMYNYLHGVPMIEGLWQYILIEYCSFTTLFFIANTFRWRALSLWGIAISIINTILPVKLPLGTSFISYSHLYPLWVYLGVMITIITLNYTFKRYL